MEITQVSLLMKMENDVVVIDPMIDGSQTTVGQQIKQFDLSVIKVSNKKIPFEKWSQYRSEISPISTWQKHFLEGGYIGIITGKVSGNLEILDFDLKNDPEKTIYEEFAKLVPAELLERLIKQTTVNGGFHLIYRCPEVIEGNLKLANSIEGETIIETRGEGGYFCHHLKDYRVVNGNFDMKALSYEIPVITADEREIMHSIARSLNRKFIRQKDGSYQENAVNRFNQEYNILDLFENHGWPIEKEDDEKYYLNRPDSSNTHSGYYFKDTKTFICFSSSTDFEPSKPYNHLQVLQVLSKEKDYRTCLKMIEKLGFTLENDVPQTNRNSKKVSADEIAAYLNNNGVRYDTFIQDLTMCGRVITENQYNTLSIDLKKHYDSEIPRAKFEEVIKSDYVKTHDPILDFVEEHKDCFSEGNFEQWVDCLELKNKDVKRSTVVHFFRKWYVGMIAQAMNGEYPNEFFLSLLSVKQGIGKTTILRKFVLPVELQKYVLEHALSFDDDFKVIMGQGILIIDDEMDGRTYEAERSFKSLLSTKELTTRRKYDRRISNIKRRASFAGSGNNKFVVKEKQNRRILPIEIEKIDYKKLDGLKLDELFMEAYNLFINGFKYSFENSDTTLLEELYMDYRQISELDLIFEEEIKAPEDENDILYISCLDLVLVLSEKYGKSSKMINSKSIGNQMVEMKIDRTRRSTKKTTCYSISKKSSVINLLDTNSISYSLNPCLSGKRQSPDEIF